MNRGVWVYDIETLKSCFTYTGINIDTEEVVQYALHKDRWDERELLFHLSSCKGQIGFNNLDFDYPIIHCVLENTIHQNGLTSGWDDLKPKVFIENIYGQAQSIINEQDIFKRGIRAKDIRIPQLDLFKIWHYNNKARRTSLKALEISMNYPNVMDMPIHHSKEDISLEEVYEILKYNLNDVLATYEFYKRSIEKIELRKLIRKKYNIECLNWNNGKIGEQLILKLYCEKTGLDKWDVTRWRTKRDKIALNDCIPSYVKFSNRCFSDLLLFFKHKTVTGPNDSSAEYSIIYKGARYDYGLGGVHAVVKSGVYESDSEYVIQTADVASLYPNLAINQRLYPQHLGQTFCDVYEEDIVNVRMKEKAKGKLADKSIVDGYKQAANIPYGKSNDENSFLYDPLYTLKTTISGQLLLTMLVEKVSMIDNAQILMVNTDGFEVRLHRSKVEEYRGICKEWEELTKLVLEFDEYQKMIILNVNNYTAITTSGKVKHKGLFEVDKLEGSEPAFHKDNSFRVVPLALERFFKDGIPVEETIRTHKDIYDFCGRQKFGRDSKGETHEVAYDESGNPYELIVEQQKNVRYYISTKGATFVKIYSDKSKELINKGYLVTVFNKYEEREDYGIDYQFYIRETYKIIDVVIPKQMTLL
jgi:hypothetical protein